MIHQARISGVSKQDTYNIQDRSTTTERTQRTRDSKMTEEANNSSVVGDEPARNSLIEPCVSYHPFLGLLDEVRRVLF